MNHNGMGYSPAWNRQQLSPIHRPSELLSIHPALAYLSLAHSRRLLWQVSHPWGSLSIPRCTSLDLSLLNQISVISLCHHQESSLNIILFAIDFIDFFKRANHFGLDGLAVDVQRFLFQRLEGLMELLASVWYSPQAHCNSIKLSLLEHLLYCVEDIVTPKKE